MNLPPNEAFLCACWDYKHGIRKTEPTAKEFGLCECVATSLAVYCHAEFENSIVQKAIRDAQGGGVKAFHRKHRHAACSGMRRRAA